VPPHNPRDHPLHPRRLVAREFPVLAVDVVHHFRDGGERGSDQPEAEEQGLKGAAVALVGVFGLEHVEPQLARSRLVIVGCDEAEPGVGIDEAADQPRTRDPVHVHATAGHPGVPLARPRRGARRGPARGRSVALPCQRERGGRRATPRGAEEIDCPDLGESPLQARQLA
jgi:hypothetical protein